jgi:hypothetical protein
MLVVLISLAAGVVLLLLGLGKIAHVGQMASTVVVGISFGLLLFSLTHWAFGRRRKPTVPGTTVPGGKVDG